jgi:hypothetical protein
MCDAFPFKLEVKLSRSTVHAGTMSQVESILSSYFVIVNHRNSLSHGYSLTSALSVRTAEFLNLSASSYAPDLKRSSILAAESASIEHIVCNRESREAFTSRCRHKRVSSSLSSTPPEYQTNLISGSNFLSTSDPVFYCLNQYRPGR